MTIWDPDARLFHGSEMAEVRRPSEKAIQSCKCLLEWQASGRGMSSFPPSCHPQEDSLLEKDTTVREGQGAV